MGQMIELKDLLAALSSRGIKVIPDFTGSVVRGGHNNRFWFVGNKHDNASGTVHYFANYGDWRTGQEWEWESDIPVNAAEAATIRGAMAAQKKKLKADRVRDNDEAAAQTEKFLANECVWQGFSPYLEKKGFKPGELFGAGLTVMYDKTHLVIPYRDVTGKAWGYQRIDDDGEKRFLAGAKIIGNFFQIGPLTDTAYICEGFATGAAIARTASKAVFVAFNSGNLLPAAKAIRKAFPSLRLVLVADNDHMTLIPATKTQPAVKNPGVTAATQVWKEGYIQAVIIPPFGAKDKGTDANDYLVSQGEEALATLLSEGETADLVEIRKSFLEIPSDVTSVVPGAGGGALDPAPQQKATRPKKPHELLMAHSVLERLNGNIVAYKEDIWLWDGRHWAFGDEDKVTYIKRMFHDLDPELSSGAVESTYRTLLMVAPRAPSNLFQPNPNIQSFRDCMVFLSEGADGESRLQEGPHDPKQFCTTYIDINWKTKETTRNELFEQTLDAAFEGDPYKDEKIIAIKELSGAMLFPSFPRVMFFFGVPGSNKSTIASALLHMIPKQVQCQVDPGEMDGFMKEATINCLVNSCLDINESKPFPMPIIKRLLDRLPETINRKNKKAISALPPGVHLYAANSMPPNFEKTVGPLARRITIVQFTRHVTVNQDGTTKDFTRKDYWKAIVGLNQSQEEMDRLQEGLVNFMKDGLARLVARKGMFTNIVSSQAALEMWHKDSNAVLQFLDDIEEGEATFDGTVKIVRDPEGSISRTDFFEAFKTWCKVAAIPDNRFSRSKFYLAMRGAGIEERRSHAERMILGFRKGSTPNAVA